MLPQFMLYSYEKTAQQREVEKLAELMAELPTETLEKVARYGCMSIGGGMGGLDWLERFKGTPLFPQALALERAELQSDTQREQFEEMQDQRFKERDQSRMQRRLLELQLVEFEEGQLQMGAGAPGAAGPPPGAPPPAAPAGPPSPEGGGEMPPGSAGGELSPKSITMKMAAEDLDKLALTLTRAGHALEARKARADQVVNEAKQHRHSEHAAAEDEYGAEHPILGAFRRSKSQAVSHREQGAAAAHGQIDAKMKADKHEAKLASLKVALLSPAMMTGLKGLASNPRVQSAAMGAVGAAIPAALSGGGVKGTAIAALGGGAAGALTGGGAPAAPAAPKIASEKISFSLEAVKGLASNPFVREHAGAIIGGGVGALHGAYKGLTDTDEYGRSTGGLSSALGRGLMEGAAGAAVGHGIHGAVNAGQQAHGLMEGGAKAEDALKNVLDQRMTAAASGLAPHVSPEMAAFGQDAATKGHELSGRMRNALTALRGPALPPSPAA